MFNCWGDVSAIFDTSFVFTTEFSFGSPIYSFPALIIPIVITQDLRHVKVCIGVVEENVKSYLRPLLLDVLDEDGNFHGSSHLLSKNIFWELLASTPIKKMKKFKKVFFSRVQGFIKRRQTLTFYFTSSMNHQTKCILLYISISF